MAKEPRNTAGDGRRRRKRDDELLRTATEVFWQNGYPASTIQQVADAMGVLKGSLYYYIDSKEDLLFWIFDACHADASSIMAEIDAMEEPPLVRLQTFIRRFVEFYLHNVERVSLYFRQWRYLTGERRETVIGQRAEYERFVDRLIREAQEVGDLPDTVDPKYIGFFVLGAVNGIPDWYRRKGRDSPEHISAAYAELAIRVVGGSPVMELPAP